MPRWGGWALRSCLVNPPMLAHLTIQIIAGTILDHWLYTRFLLVNGAIAFCLLEIATRQKCCLTKTSFWDHWRKDGHICFLHNMSTWRENDNCFGAAGHHIVCVVAPDMSMVFSQLVSCAPEWTRTVSGMCVKTVICVCVMEKTNKRVRGKDGEQRRRWEKKPGERTGNETLRQGRDRCWSMAKWPPSETGSGRWWVGGRGGGKAMREEQRRWEQVSVFRIYTGWQGWREAKATTSCSLFLTEDGFPPLRHKYEPQKKCQRLDFNLICKKICPPYPARYVTHSVFRVSFVSVTALCMYCSHH